MRKSRPGPTGTSCLTCKQRRKKCDRREPICERCEASDFECLGYDHIRPVVPSTARSLRPLLPKRPAKAASQSPSDGASSTEHSTGSSYGNNHQEVPDWEAIAHPLQDAALNLSHAPHPTPEIHTFDQVDTSGGTSAFTRTIDHNLYRSSQLALQATESSVSVFHQIIKLYSQLPKSLSDPFNFLDDQWFIQHIVAQTEGTMGYWYFRPLQKCDSRQQIQLKVSGRLNNTKFTRWIYLAVIGIVRSFLTGDMSHIQLHNSWMDYIQGSLAAELTLDLAPREMQERWSEWLHLFETSPPYSSSDILNADSLASPFRPGTNCTYAMVSGLPQQVEYDTTIHSPLPSSSRYQITHGFPNELLLMLADINACRDMSPHARRWEHIEHQR
ncbi:Negative acting factor [Rhizoctonia solani]|uniref:Negative acting factor n=1 Tax=Rhizoctonia solani TaxID=456999 RepID=A0A8H7IFF1_9AGAM|nr:Negative acting factor [Rhizoctonia solani]